MVPTNLNIGDSPGYGGLDFTGQIYNPAGLIGATGS